MILGNTLGLPKQIVIVTPVDCQPAIMWFGAESLFELSSGEDRLKEGGKRGKGKNGKKKGKKKEGKKTTLIFIMLLQVPNPDAKLS